MAPDEDELNLAQRQQRREERARRERAQRARSLGEVRRHFTRVLAAVTFALLGAALALSYALSVQTLDVPPPAQADPPRFAVGHDAAKDTFTVLAAEPGLTWGDLELEGTCAPLVNGQPPQPSRPVSAGDTVTCQPGERLDVVSDAAHGGQLLHSAEFG